MGAPVPDDVRLKGPFQPMRFEATVEDCIVAEGEVPKDLAGGFIVGDDVEAADEAG